MSDTTSPTAVQERTPSPGPAARPLLVAAGLSKRYGPVQALADVSITIAPGEIHALVGENGSGKSTLVGIVSGTVARDTGTVEIAGSSLTAARPSASQDRGAITVFQDGSLIGELSVAKNLYLGIRGEQRPSYGRTTAWAQELLNSHGFDIDTEQSAASLPPGDRQLVEIIRAVACRPRVLILDEATSALDSRGVDIVLDLMRGVAADGGAVLFVTHRLSEVMRVADTVTVLRDGRFQGTHDAADVTPQRLVELMAGTRVDLEFPDRVADGAGDVRLIAAGLAGPSYGPVELELRAGQIVGIAGADGNGQLPLVKGLARIDDSQGTVEVDGHRPRSYGAAVDTGLVYLSSDRRNESLFQGLTIGDNLGIGVLGDLSSGGVMNLGRERSFVREAIDRYRIRVGHPGQLPSELSGGNQQKVALSRVLAMKPAVVLIDEPTQGVDVRSRLDIYRFLRQIADAGSAVVVVSSDASELAGLCDRILVMSRGKVTSELPGIGATEESIVGAFAVEHEISADVEPGSGEVAATPASSPRTWLRRRISADGIRLVALVALMVGLALFAQSKNDTFLTEISIYNVLLVALPLVAVAAAQYFVLMVGGIDVSVGATMTLAVVLMSEWATEGGTGKVLGMGLAIALLLGIAVGAVNAFLVERIKLSPVIATIATLGVVSGIALMMRPTAEGLIAPQLGVLLMMKKVGPVPVALVVLLVVLVVVDFVVRRTGTGLRLRAVGLNAVYATRLGIPTPWVRALCYVLCAFLAGIAGILLAAQVGIGDPNAGTSFTLLAIAAPVLGGAALSGGHGSLVGAAIGAGILVLTQSLVTVLGLSDGTSYVFAGTLTLLALLSSADSIRRLRRLLRFRLQGG
ncbi:ATP-binding cassette domain-containing protein [Nocardioides sp. URHA0032]|uniref:ATP-binding cassette domain-containing protein n=1 Tax=Nocardioides sp. URHA0032 TaxID=1380388 RepID=UPI0005654E6B|nr:ATP-binding cassette domain-containing protein [Nocardioides sp. URHA0032]